MLEPAGPGAGPGDNVSGADEAAADSAILQAQEQQAAGEGSPGHSGEQQQQPGPLPGAADSPGEPMASHQSACLSSGPVLEHILSLSGCANAIALSSSTCIRTWAMASVLTWCCTQRPRQEVLLRAARTGQTPVLQALLQQQQHSHQQQLPEGQAAALCAAAGAGQGAPVQALLDHWARVTTQQQQLVGPINEALKQAASEGQASTCRALLAHPLCAPAHASRNGMGHFLLLRAAAERDHAEVARALLDHPQQVVLGLPNADSALIWASMQGHLRTVQAMLEHPSGVCDVNGLEGEPLKVAAMRNRKAVCEYLLSRGADPNLRDSISMRIAAMNGHTHLVKLLLAHGAHADASDSLALLYAAGPRGSPDMVRALLEAPHHPAHADAQRSQALRAAAVGGRFNACRLLLSAPHRPARLEHCWGVIHEAAARGHHRVLALLQEAAQRYCGLNYNHAHSNQACGTVGLPASASGYGHPPPHLAHPQGPHALQPMAPSFVPASSYMPAMGAAAAGVAAMGGGAAFLTGPP